MNTLVVHILAGEQALLEPDSIHSHELAAFCGPGYRSVPAYWLSSEAGRYTHDFLADPVDDNRIAVFARSLATDYTRTSRPLLIIPRLSDLSAGSTATWAPVLHALRSMLAEFGRDCQFQLHMLTSSMIADSAAKLARLQAWMTAQGLPVQVAEDALVSVPFTDDLQPRLERNVFASRVFLAVAARCHQLGLHVSDADRLQRALAQRVARLADMGLQPVMPLDEALISRVSAAVLAEVTDPDIHRAT